MDVQGNNANELLAMVEAGRLDELTRAQVADLEQLLNRSGGAARRIADMTPPRDALLCAALGAPTASEWNATWERIGEAEGASRSTTVSPWRLLRGWQGISAVAACIAFVLLLRLAWPAPREDSWPLQLADNVEITELETYGDASSLVAYNGEGDGSAIIWVYEDDDRG